MSPGAFLRRPAVRVTCALAATAVLGVTVWASGAGAVLDRLGASAHALPALALLEAAMVACSTLALRALYGPAAATVSLRQWLRVGAAGYAVGLVLPMGRGSGEAARAVLLSRDTSGPRAAVAAVQMQGVVLLSTAVFVLPVLAATLLLLGPGLVAALVLGNGAVAGVVGASILLVRARARPGRLLGGLVQRFRRFGAAFDDAAGASRAELLRSLAWETLGRVAQAVQCGVALAALGHPAKLVRVLVIRGLLMVGSALGDVLPGQLGATEATLALGADAVQLTAASAASLALLVHGAQILLGLACTAVAFGLPWRQAAAPEGAELTP